jgi:hypothetical protein
MNHKHEGMKNPQGYDSGHRNRILERQFLSYGAKWPWALSSRSSQFGKQARRWSVRES